MDKVIEYLNDWLEDLSGMPLPKEVTMEQAKTVMALFAKEYFSSHFVEAVRKILPRKRLDSTIPSCRSEIQSGFNACFNNAIDEVLENAERLVKGETTSLSSPSTDPKQTAPPA